MFEFPNEFIVYINAVLILLFVFTLYRGYKKGMLLQLVGLVSTFVALIVAWLFSDVFLDVFQFVTYSKSGLSSMDKFISSHANRLIWFVVLFVVIRIAMLILTPIASAISKMPLIKQVNSVMGGIFSFVTYFVYLLFIIYFLTLPIIKNGVDIIEHTYLRPIHDYLQPVVTVVDTTIQENESIQFLMSERKLSISQKQSLVDLLSDNGFTNEEIREFITKHE